MAYGIKTGGRGKGTPNKVTTVFKDAVRTVYEDIGGHAAFAEWARGNPSDFYRIASRLIPTESTNLQDTDRQITVNIAGVIAPEWHAVADPMCIEH
jgi:cobalamin biosynthesis Mg chelatase CobN